MAASRSMTEIAPVVGVSRVLFPGMRCAVSLVDPTMRRAVAAASQQRVALFAARWEFVAPPALADLYPVGTLASVGPVENAPCCGREVVRLEGLCRIRCHSLVDTGAAVEARFERLLDAVEDTRTLIGLTTALKDAARRMNQSFPGCTHTREALTRASEVELPDQFPGAVSGLLRHLPLEAQQHLLEAEPLTIRLQEALGEIHGYLARFGPRPALRIVQ
jgi:ATP-dependent Lon protease